MRQLDDAKEFLITKIESRIRELKTEVSKSVRVKRSVVSGRKSLLDRSYLQTDYALAFVNFAIGCQDDEGDRAILLAKR